MLKMRCPKCRKPIRSHLLAEVTTVFCNSCNEYIAVNEVYITAKGYTMLRKDLLSRTHRYEKLLHEAEKEMNLISRSPGISAESVKSINKFVTMLKELLDGARNNFRVHVPDVTVKYNSENGIRSARLVNLSVVGACIEPESTDHLPKIKKPITLNFALPGFDESFLLKGKVAWVKKGAKYRDFETGIGVKFEYMDEATRSRLWKFIAFGEKGWR